MGFFKSLIGHLHADPNRDNAPMQGPAGSSNGSASDVFPSQVGLVGLSGTTTICKEEIARFAGQHQLAENGYLEIEGKMQREPANTYDPSAIAVFAEGYKVGYLPGHVARALQLPPESSRTLRIQLFTVVLQQGLRCEAWAWIGSGDPQWAWSKEHRPPMSSKEKRHARFEATESMLRSQTQESPERAAEIRQGTANGIHYLETVEPIQELKREGRLEEALQLTLTAIQGAENETQDTHREPAPWYTQQAAIILRKLHRPQDEIAILQRWIDHCPAEYIEKNPDNAISNRLRELKTKQ